MPKKVLIIDSQQDETDNSKIKKLFKDSGELEERNYYDFESAKKNLSDCDLVIYHIGGTCGYNREEIVATILEVKRILSEKDFRIVFVSDGCEFQNLAMETWGYTDSRAKPMYFNNLLRLIQNPREAKDNPGDLLWDAIGGSLPQDALVEIHELKHQIISSLLPLLWRVNDSIKRSNKGGAFENAFQSTDLSYLQSLSQKRVTAVRNLGIIKKNIDQLSRNTADVENELQTIEGFFTGRLFLDVCQELNQIRTEEDLVDWVKSSIDTLKALFNNWQQTESLLTKIVSDVDSKLQDR